jgi:hypothetical protein
MAMVKYHDEKDLQRKICGILNKGGYDFKKERDSFFCDIVDYNIEAYGEIKIDGKFAPQQLLYGLAKEHIRDARYLILANEFELRVYKAPEIDKIIAFAQRVSPDLSRAPSSVTEVHLIDEAFSILGTQDLIYTYVDKFRINEKHPCIFLDNNNYEYFQIILQKYRIDPAEFINKFAKTWANKSRLFVKNDGVTIFDQESNNEVKAHRRITNEFDRMLIRSTRIRAENIEQILHKIDTLAPIDVRRKRGKYWSNLTVSEIVTEVVRDIVDPTFIFEPFVGGGSLVRDLVNDVSGVANDIDGSMIDLLEKEWEGLDWTLYRRNFLTSPMDTDWGFPAETGRFLVYTNPPFGSSCLRKYTLTTDEQDVLQSESKKSSKISVQYGSPGEAKYFGDTYGRGDLCIPSIAHVIEIVKRRGSGYIAFFSPFGMMVGRKRYRKVLLALLNDFEFLYGEVFPGSMFNGVNKNKAISFTVWKYNTNVNTSQESLWFLWGDKEYETRQLPLLKDRWRYRDGAKYVESILPDDIGVVNTSYFSTPYPKFFTTNIKEGATALLRTENVRISLGVSNVPDELIYGLWSVAVGNRSMTTYPPAFDNCYVHLPDFTRTETLEILAYAVMSALITEMKASHCDDKIGFVGMRRQFTFGNRTITAGAQYLIDTYGELPIGSHTVGDLFIALKDVTEPDEVGKDLRILIRSEMQSRLTTIGYWEYLPVPRLGRELDGDDTDEK